MTLSFAKPELARVGRVMRCAIAATITVAVCSGQTAAQERIARNDAGSPPRANTVTHSMRTFVDSIVIPSSLSSESRVLRGRATTALLAQASSQPKFGALSADSARKLAAKLRWRLAHGTRRGTSALPLLIELLDALGAPSKAEVHAALQRLKGVEVRETVRESASGTAKRRDFYAAGVLKLSLFTSSAATTDVSREAPDPEPTGTVDAYSDVTPET